MGTKLRNCALTPSAVRLRARRARRRLLQARGVRPGARLAARLCSPGAARRGRHAHGRAGLRLARLGTVAARPRALPLTHARAPRAPARRPAPPIARARAASAAVPTMTSDGLVLSPTDYLKFRCARPCCAARGAAGAAGAATRGVCACCRRVPLRRSASAHAGPLAGTRAHAHAPRVVARLRVLRTPRAATPTALTCSLSRRRAARARPRSRAEEADPIRAEAEQPDEPADCVQGTHALRAPLVSRPRTHALSRVPPAVRATRALPAWRRCRAARAPPPGGERGNAPEAAREALVLRHGICTPCVRL
jgi:hypothetical protein